MWSWQNIDLWGGLTGRWGYAGCVVVQSAASLRKRGRDLPLLREGTSRLAGTAAAAGRVPSRELKRQLDTLYIHAESNVQKKNTFCLFVFYRLSGYWKFKKFR